MLEITKINAFINSSTKSVNDMVHSAILHDMLQAAWPAGLLKRTCQVILSLPPPPHDNTPLN